MTAGRSLKQHTATLGTAPQRWCPVAYLNKAVRIGGRARQVAAHLRPLDMHLKGRHGEMPRDEFLNHDQMPV